MTSLLAVNIGVYLLPNIMDAPATANTTLTLRTFYQTKAWLAVPDPRSLQSAAAPVEYLHIYLHLDFTALFLWVGAVFETIHREFLYEKTSDRYVLIMGVC